MPRVRLGEGRDGLKPKLLYILLTILTNTLHPLPCSVKGNVSRFGKPLNDFVSSTESKWTRRKRRIPRSFNSSTVPRNFVASIRDLDVLQYSKSISLQSATRNLRFKRLDGRLHNQVHKTFDDLPKLSLYRRLKRSPQDPYSSIGMAHPGLAMQTEPIYPDQDMQLSPTLDEVPKPMYPNQDIQLSTNEIVSPKPLYSNQDIQLSTSDNIFPKPLYSNQNMQISEYVFPKPMYPNQNMQPSPSASVFPKPMYPTQDMHPSPTADVLPNNLNLEATKQNDEKRFGEIMGSCDVSNECRDGQYCAGKYCYKCRKKEKQCFANGQCCEGLGCQFGYCVPAVKPGQPGTFCDRTSDCNGEDLCCILELAVDNDTPICKPMLNEHEACGPINLFHQRYHDTTDSLPFCGPCKPGLACMGVGITGHHSVCLPTDQEK